MKNIAVIPNNKKDIGLVCTRRIVNCLTGKANLYMNKMYAVSDLPVQYVPGEELYEKVEIVIVLGGDGTILQIANQIANKDIAVMGINLGRIGFMSEIEVDDIEKAAELLINDYYRIEQRMMMQVQIKKDGNIQGSYPALNDVVISKSAGTKLIGMKLFADGEKVNAYIADGLILATPTGSTGYSLSAGGPVVDPLMRLFIATPICAHMLSARSAVLSADKEIVIRLDEDFAENDAMVSIDGDVQAYIKNGDEISVTIAKHQTKLIKIGNQSFYDTLIRKLS
jgi:NAD+ kinase